MNIVTVVLVFIGALVNGVTPVTPAQLLWLNIIMDTLGVLALATEPPTMGVLSDYEPLERDEAIITNPLKRNIILNAIFQITILLWMLFGGKSAFNLPYKSTDYFYDAVTGEPTNKCIHYTMMFNSLVLQTIF